MPSERSFFIIAYDISENRRRSKIAKLMESLGFRVQGSVFEGWLTEAEFVVLKKKTEKIIQPDEDSVRIYKLCAVCCQKIVIIGQGRATNPPGLVII